MDESLSQAAGAEAGSAVHTVIGRQRTKSAALGPLGWISAHRAALICVLLLGIMGVQMLAAVSRKSISTDEVVHIPAGYYHLVLGDFQFLNQHPPVSMMIGTLPLLFLHP